MSKRYRKTQDKQLATPGATTILPLDQPAAVYYRQSTDAQVGNISTAIQTIDMVAYVKRLGWPDDKILLIDMDHGVSGTTKIDEREGMSELFGLITDRRIGAVACQDEDRLFRDVTQIQVNTFIEACKDAHVLVLTPSMIYDFANPLTGTFHARQFRFKCEMAAEYINAVIKGKLQSAKRRLAMEGSWAGACVPVGYMVDVRRQLADGSKNPNLRRFMPFGPFADIVNAYFDLLLQHAGNIHATSQHIHENGPWYPDPAHCKPPDGFKLPYRLHNYGKGYCPSTQGLVQLLTNVIYLGHWTVNGQVVRWNNHPAIVPEDKFTRAFNYLSPVGLDGSPNPDFRPFFEYTRPTLENDRTVERPLCSGLLVSEHAGVWRMVGTQWLKQKKLYVYNFSISHPVSERVWTRQAWFIDTAITQVLLEKLEATFDNGVWEQTLATFMHDYEAVKRLRQAQMANLEKVKQNYLDSMAVLSSREMIKAVETRYQDSEKELARLVAEQQSDDKQARDYAILGDLKETCGPALANWDNLSRDEKRVILGSFVEKIEATVANERDLRLVVVWRDNSCDEAILPALNKNGSHCWLASERERLLAMVDGDAPQVAIAREFPLRTWDNVRDKVIELRGAGVFKPKPKPIKDDETYQDFLVRTTGSLSNTITGTDTSAGWRRQPAS
jgi:DNA invertase Pin-like site-specific DNA recombinase